MVDRQSEDAARELIETFIPAPDERREILATLARLIDILATERPHTWSITLLPQRVSVNISTRLIFGIRPGEVWTGVSGEDAPADLTKIIEQTGDAESFRIDIDTVFAWIPVSDYLRHRGRFEEQLFATARYFAGKARTARYRRQHSPNVLRYIEAELGRDLPNPDFSSNEAGFDQFLQQFLDGYLASDKGQQHISMYAPIREAARQNWVEIQRERSSGHDTTDLVLKKLLPHRDTESNRARGAWTHVAPVVTRDIHQWFEGAGWASPEDWPGISAAIFDFVDSALQEPERFEEHCSRFSASSESKGFQSGFLTPILNALDPVHYAIYNMKSRSTINRLTGSDFGAKLIDYPAANRVIFDFIDAETEISDAAQQHGVLAIDLFDCFSHWLVAESDEPSEANGDLEYWKIAPGENARLWDLWRNEQYCSIGWDEIGDVSKMSRPEFLKKIAEVGPQFRWTKGAEQVWHFAHIPEGSWIIANRGKTRIVGVGQVQGPYYFVPGQEHGHRLSVQWVDTSERVIDEGGWRPTMVSLSEERFRTLRKAPLESSSGEESSEIADSPVRPAISSRSRYTIEHALNGLFMERSALERILRSLQGKKNIILQGPPGVGKTFIAKRIAYALIGFESTYHVETVQFHQSYAYEDFVQGWRPNKKGGFEIRNGVFYEFCQRARDSQDEKFVFIIDEINRGNLSKIFGELMMLIESDKRGPKSALPLTYRSNDTDNFFVPENLYVIGMMNTADRSLAMVDYALRRRFTFHTLKPAFASAKFREDLRSRCTDGLANTIIDTMIRLNEAIAKEEKHLGADFEIGHSFFCAADGRHDQQWFDEVIELEIAPLIREYWFDNSTKRKEMLAILRVSDDLT